MNFCLLLGLGCCLGFKSLMCDLCLLHMEVEWKRVWRAGVDHPCLNTFSSRQNKKAARSSSNNDTPPRNDVDWRLEEHQRLVFLHVGFGLPTCFFFFCLNIWLGLQSSLSRTKLLMLLVLTRLWNKRNQLVHFYCTTFCGGKLLAHAFT